MDIKHFQQELLNLEGQLALSNEEAQTAERKFVEGLKVDPKPDVALQQAAILGSHGLPQAALDHLAEFDLGGLFWKSRVAYFARRGLVPPIPARNG